MNKIIIFLSIILCTTTQAMEQGFNFYDGKIDISVLVQAVDKVKSDQEEEPEEELKVLEQKNSKVRSVKEYSCPRLDCIFVASHSSRINKHKEMHRLQSSFLHIIVYRCDTCHYLTDKQRNMDEHKNSHNNRKEHYCKVCDTWFASAKGKSRHEKESFMHKQNSKERSLAVSTKG